MNNLTPPAPKTARRPAAHRVRPGKNHRGFQCFEGDVGVFRGDPVYGFAGLHSTQDRIDGHAGFLDHGRAAQDRFVAHDPFGTGPPIAGRPLPNGLDRRSDLVHIEGQHPMDREVPTQIGRSHPTEPPCDAHLSCNRHRPVDLAHDGHVSDRVCAEGLAKRPLQPRQTRHPDKENALFNSLADGARRDPGQHRHLVCREIGFLRHILSLSGETFNARSVRLQGAKCDEGSGDRAGPRPTPGNEAAGDGAVGHPRCRADRRVAAGGAGERTGDDGLGEVREAPVRRLDAGGDASPGEPGGNRNRLTFQATAI